MNKQYYIALDVHSEKVAIAYTREGSREEATYYGSCGGSVPNTEVTLRRIAKKLGVDFRDLMVCYEAGPTGFVLARRLIHLGLDCIVIAPTKTERKPGERIKTDRRDAQKLAKLFRNGDLTPVRIPPASDEAVRDVCRARTDAVEDLSRSKQRLLSFLLRNGYRPKGTRWSEPYFRYLRELVLPDPNQKIVLEEYLQAIDSGIQRVERLEAKMFALLGDWEWEPVVRALMAFKGFKEVAAISPSANSATSPASSIPDNSWPSSAWFPARSPPAPNAARGPSPSAATVTPVGCSSRVPRPTAICPRSPPISASVRRASPGPSKNSPGGLRTASLIATASSRHVANARTRSSSP